MTTKTTKFGNLPVSESAKEKRGGVKFFNSATFEFNQANGEGNQQKKAPSYMDIDSLTPGEPSESPLGAPCDDQK